MKIRPGLSPREIGRIVGDNVNSIGAIEAIGAELNSRLTDFKLEAYFEEAASRWANRQCEITIDDTIPY